MRVETASVLTLTRGSKPGPDELALGAMIAERGMPFHTVIGNGGDGVFLG